MDEKVETSVSEMEPGVEDVPPAQEQGAATRWSLQRRVHSI